MISDCARTDTLRKKNTKGCKARLTIKAAVKRNGEIKRSDIAGIIRGLYIFVG